MRYRMLALDLDGTLLNSRKELTPRTHQVLASARSLGIVTVIATGRTVHSARQWSLAAGGGPVICCNGAGVFAESGELLIAKGIPREPLIRVLELCRTHGVMAECYTTDGIILDRPFDQIQAFWDWVRPGMSPPRAVRSLIRAWWTNKIRPVRNLVSWASRPVTPPVLKLMVIGSATELQKLSGQIMSETPGLEITSSGKGNLEITARGINKASGLEHLGARLQIPRQAVIAIGDSGNDLAMLKYAGLGIAMGNATSQVKAVADRVTATCDQEGVAKMIEEILAGQNLVHP